MVSIFHTLSIDDLVAWNVDYQYPNHFVTFKTHPLELVDEPITIIKVNKREIQ